MKFVPMIVALSVGTVCYADAFGLIDARSLMHPKSRSHIQKVEIDLTDAPKDAPELGEVVITKEILWDTDLRKATMLAEDAGDEEKRLFWHTEWGTNEGVPFTGWGDPNALNYNPWIATHSPDNPGFHFITDEPAQRHSETAAPEIAPPPVLPGIELPSLGKQKAIPVFNMEDAFPKQIVLTPEQIEAMCVVDPGMSMCVIDPVDPPVVIVKPGSPDPVILPPVVSLPDPPIVVVGPIGGGTSGGQIGSPIPEPSTWAMLIVGFIGLGWGAATRRRIRRLQDMKPGVE